MRLRCAPVVVLADGGEPEPGDVDAAVPVDVVSIQADVDGLLDASCVPMLVLVHALHAVPVGVVTSSPGVFGYKQYDTTSHRLFFPVFVIHRGDYVYLFYQEYFHKI